MNPITRKEMFLAAAGGQDVTTPTTVTREEVFLDAIAKGGGGSSGGGVLVVHEDENETLDKTYAEIKTASNDGVVLLHGGDEILYLNYIAYSSIGSAYTVSFFGNEAVADFEADAEDGYPVRVNE